MESSWTSDCGTVCLYLGNCIDVIPLLAESNIDCVVTDPPYGANASVSGRRKQNGFREATKYVTTGWTDDPAYIRSVCVEAIGQCISMFGRVAFTPGFKCMWEYPRPSHVGNLYYGAQSATTCWGMAYWQPLFLYGKDPNPMKPDTIKCRPNVHGHENGHPCPKELSSWTDVVGRVSRDGEKILDPFMGSGTTGVSCVRLGRKFVGIERESKYYAIAKRRIIDELKRIEFLEPKTHVEVQKNLIGE